MIIIHKIALRIYGGPQSEGVLEQPFVAVGDVPKEFAPQPPVLVDEQQVWMITHAQNYTLYTLSSKRCFTTDGQPGRMLICLFLPPQKRLADGKSPLALLDSLMDCFMVQALRDGNLPMAPVDNAPFAALLDECRLEARPMSLPIMQGQESASFCVGNKTQLDALMRHSRYPVLATVGRLELGFDCESTISLNTSGTRESKEKTQTTTIVEEPAAVEPSVHVEPAAILDLPTDSHPSSHVSKTYESSALGGLSLDDTPIVQKPKTGSKIATGIILLIGLGVICLFGFFILISVISLSDDKYSSDSTWEEELVDSCAVDTQLVVEAESFVNDIGDYIYTGPVDEDGMPHGVGEAKYIEGKGDVVGGIYNGPFVHGVMQGEDAEFRMENGDIFKGSFKNNQFEKGTYTMVESGDYFLGTFSNGKPHTGTWYSKDGKKLQDVK